MFYDNPFTNNIVVPKEQILCNNNFVGYTMQYYDNITPLYKLPKECDYVEFLKIVKKVSLLLKLIHANPLNIVVSDLNFSNIIIYNNEPYFIDVDSFEIAGLISNRIPSILYSYFNKRHFASVDVNQNSDRFCLVLCTLYSIFSKGIDNVNMYEYDEKAEQIEMLKNMRECVLKIKKEKLGFLNIPYIDEFIKEDSKKQLIYK